MSEIEQILVVESYAEALIIEARLTREEIPYLFRPFNDPAFGSFWRRQEGWGIILAPGGYRDRIREICADIRGASEEG